MVVKSIKASDDNAEYKCAAISNGTKSVEPIRLRLSGIIYSTRKKLIVYLWEMASVDITVHKYEDIT